MSFLASIPILGNLFAGLGDAIDKNVTTDHERLRMKAELTQLTMPALISVIEAQKSFNDMQVQLASVEAKSEHFLQWARRPLVALFSALNFFVSLWLFVAGIVPQNLVEFSFYFALAANGLDMGTRGIEKIVRVMKDKEQI